MPLSREFMILEIRKIKGADGQPKYNRVKVKGGYASLETAPTGNLFYMYRNVTGRVKTIEQKKKENQLMYHI